MFGDLLGDATEWIIRAKWEGQTAEDGGDRQAYLVRLPWKRAAYEGKLSTRTDKGTAGNGDPQHTTDNMRATGLSGSTVSFSRA
jgi:hypothetical protein